MKTQDYSATISVKATPEEAFKKVAKVDGWWAKDFTGNAKKNNGTFTVRFGDTSVDFKVTESIPAKSLVWQVADCNLAWIKNKKEWKGTRVVWELTPHNGITQIKMTHVGLVPGVECYHDCETGWNGYVKGSLVNFIDDGKGQPQ